MFPRRTLLALLFFALLAGAALHVLHRYAALTGAPDTHRLFQQNLDAADTLSIERGDRSISLQRHNSQWDILHPVVASADTRRIRQLLDALEALPVIDQFSPRTLEQRKLSLELLGLSPPQARLTLTVQGHSTTLDIGHASPSGNALYLIHSGFPGKVLVTDAALLRQLPANFSEFRQRLLIPALVPQITALEIRRPAQPTLRLTRKDNLWHIVQPIAGRASQLVVAELTQALAALSIESFVWPETLSESGQPPSFARYGLDTESALSLLIWEQEKSSPLRIRLGHPPASSPGLLYALAADQTTIVTVTNSALPFLDLSPADFRDRRLFRENPDHLASLSIRYPNQTLELECDADRQWMLNAPLRSRANQATVRAFINTLLTLRADKIIADDSLPGAASILPPEQQMTLNFKNLPPLSLNYQFGPVLSQFAFTNAPAVVYLIPSTNLPPELVSLDEATIFADPQIINVPSDAVKRLTLATPASTQTFERVSAAWQSSTSATDLLPKIPQWIDELSHLRAERVAQLTPLFPLQLDSLHLAPPEYEITLDLSESDALRRVLAIGVPSPTGGRYAALRGSDVLYILSTNINEKLTVNK